MPLTNTPLVVREPQRRDEPAWLRLWKGYLDFYEAAVSTETTHHTWRRILDATGPVFGRIATRDGAAVGFAICVRHERSWSVRPTCYLEDLFVDPVARRTGVGRALIDDLVAIAGERGWDSIYWHTRDNNAPARMLYDSYVPADDLVRYRLVMTPQPR